VPKPVRTILRVTDWIDLGGASYVRGIRMTANTFNQTIQLGIRNGDDNSLVTIPILHNGQQEIAYAFRPPFVAHLVRLEPASGSSESELWGDPVFIKDDYPELIPAYTSILELGGPDAKYMRGVRITADSADSPVSFAVLYDGGQAGPVIGTLPFNGKQTIPFAFTPPFVAHNVQLVPNAPVRIFIEECKYDLDVYPELIPEYTSIMERGGPDAKYVQGVVLTADTENIPVAFQVLYDGGKLGPMLPLTAFNGKQSIPFSFAPFRAHDIQLVPQAAARIWAQESDWVFTPTPELVTVWHPQPTSFGIEGYLHVRELRPAVMGAGSCVVAGQCEFGSWSVTVALSGAYQKVYVPVPVNKGMFYDLSITGSAVRVFADDFEVVAKQWGSTGPYAVLRPFGQPNTQGARI